jgi:hypothetical protein
MCTHNISKGFSLGHAWRWWKLQYGEQSHLVADFFIFIPDVCKTIKLKSSIAVPLLYQSIMERQWIYKESGAYSI